MPQSSADQLQSIPMSPSLGQSLGKAKDFAREQAHRAITLEHLLLALIEDADATGVLRACNIDIDRLGTDVSGYLGGLLEDMRAAPGTEPGPDPELLRVVEAARQAATQSRRRTIDGAIVLAAIVGDAKSPAAGLLKAHGMTFEEAIKTLQKASAQARSKQFSASSQRAPGEQSANDAPEKAAAASAPAPPSAKVSAPSAATDPPPGQMADEFLAAARARIQQRNASPAPAKSETQSPVQSPAQSQAKPPAGSPQDEPEDGPSAGTANRAGAAADALPPLNGAASQADPGAGPAAAAPAPPPTAPPAPASPGAPQGPPEPRSEARSPAPPRGAPMGPPGGLPGGFQLGADGAARLGPVPPGSSGAPPMPRAPDRMARGERADGSGAPLKRPPGANGAMPGQRRPPVEAPRPSGRQSAPSTRGGQRAAAGPLMEAIPRKMRVGRAASAQVRIGRDKVDSLMLLLTGSRMQHPDAIAVRVLSVRLRAPEGGFAIEPGTPETQWIETTPGQPQDDHVAWYWTVTPLWRGRWPLLLQVSARAVGRDGIAAEQAPPERVIEVSVRPNLLRRLGRWITGAVLLTFGAAVGWLSQDKLAEDFVDVVTLLAKNILGLLRTSGFLP